MAKFENFPAVYAELKAILQPYAGQLKVAADTADTCTILAKPTAKYPDGLQFCATIIKKNYVSYYLMPIYMCPDLNEMLSATLKKRKQGKSCFNFAVTDVALFAEVARLTKAGYARFVQMDLV